MARLAADTLAAGEALAGLRLTDAALAADPAHKSALEIRPKILEFLKRESRNSNELEWLDFSIHDVQATPTQFSATSAGGVRLRGWRRRLRRRSGLTCYFDRRKAMPTTISTTAAVFCIVTASPKSATPIA